MCGLGNMRLLDYRGRRSIECKSSSRRRAGKRRARSRRPCSLLVCPGEMIFDLLLWFAARSEEASELFGQRTNLTRREQKTMTCRTHSFTEKQPKKTSGSVLPRRGTVFFRDPAGNLCRPMCSVLGVSAKGQSVVTDFWFSGGQQSCRCNPTTP